MLMLNIYDTSLNTSLMEWHYVIDMSAKYKK